MDAPPLNPVPGAPVVGKTYDLTLWIVQKAEELRKSYRFSVGRLIDMALDLLLLLVEAAYRRDKRDALRTASIRTNGLRFLLRLAHDLKLLSDRRQPALQIYVAGHRGHDFGKLSHDCTSQKLPRSHNFGTRGPRNSFTASRYSAPCWPSTIATCP